MPRATLCRCGCVVRRMCCGSPCGMARPRPRLRVTPRSRTRAGVACASSRRSASAGAASLWPGARSCGPRSPVRIVPAGQHLEGGPLVSAVSEVDRVAALYEYADPEAAQSTDIDDIVAEAATVAGVLMATLNLIDTERQC